MRLINRDKLFCILEIKNMLVKKDGFDMHLNLIKNISRGLE